MTDRRDRYMDGKHMMNDGSKPLIGISCNTGEQELYGVMQKEVHSLNSTYTEAIIKCGGIPLIIPSGITKEDIPELADRLDGFLLSGGGDIDPQRYGVDTDQILYAVSDLRDQTELSLTKYVLSETEKPIFCICRGMQILNVALGGTLIVDLPSIGKDDHSPDISHESFAHEITVADKTRLSEILQEERRVNSSHHQAIDKLGEKLTISAYSAHDHIVEGIEMAGDRFVLGVQWHPEALLVHAGHKRLFETFIEAAGHTVR